MSVLILYRSKVHACKWVFTVPKVTNQRYEAVSNDSMMTLRYALKHVLVRRLRSSNSNYHDHSCDAFDKEKSAHRCVFAQARDIVLVYLSQSKPVGTYVCGRSESHGLWSRLTAIIIVESSIFAWFVIIGPLFPLVRAHKNKCVDRKAARNFLPKRK